MKTYLVLLVLLLQLTTLHAQQPSLSWAHKLTGNAEPRAVSIATDAAGNVYTTGNYGNGTIDADAGPGVFILSQPVNAQGFFIIKDDPNGNFTWAKQLLSLQCIGFSCTVIDNVAPIAVDSAGDSYVTGVFAGIVDFDPGPGAYNLSSANGQAFILKLDRDGNMVWAKQLNASGINMNGIAVDKNGNICITGAYSYNTDDFDPGPGEYHLIVAGYSSAFILKLDSAGNFIWAKSMGGSNYTRGYAIATDNSGAVYSAGQFPFTTDFDPGPGVFNLTAAVSTGPSGADQLDGYVCKLDANRNFVWAKRMGGNQEDGIVCLKADRAGNVYAAGYFRGAIDLTPSATALSVTSAGDMDVLITRIDAAGNFVWAKTSAVFPGTRSLGWMSIASEECIPPATLTSPPTLIRLLQLPII